MEEWKRPGLREFSRRLKGNSTCRRENCCTAMTLREVAPGESCGSDCCALFSQAVESRSEFFCAGQQRFYERGPFGVQGGAPKVAAGAVVPVIGIRGGPFFVVEIAVDRHAIGRFQFVNLVMRLSPIALGIPPESGEWGGQACPWSLFGERCCEFLGVHVSPLFFAQDLETCARNMTRCRKRSGKSILITLSKNCTLRIPSTSAGNRGAGTRGSVTRMPGPPGNAALSSAGS